MGVFSNTLAWAAHNERKLGAGLFAFGFFTDFFTFGLLPVGIVVWIFSLYLVLAFAAAVGAYTFAREDAGSLWKRALRISFPLLLQYAFGGLLSGLVVFYTAHSVVAASWPFLLMLALVYAGNEYFRMHKHLLVFQTTLLFFTLYACSVFVLPILVGTIGPLVFLGSTVLALVLFALFIYALHRIDPERIRRERTLVLHTVGAIVLLVCGSYFSGVIPPIPLAMRDGGMYHSLTKMQGKYVVSTEAPREWWDIRTKVLHVAPESVLYAYSAVAAPLSFSSTVMHRWEKRVNGEWITMSRISFPISGGREGGYRGYSAKGNLEEGQWRVSVETPQGQAIGRIRFDVERVEQAPTLLDATL
ncbi:MAG: DUF2914 domain-containing protein [Minisyncoccia bacterium]